MNIKKTVFFLLGLTSFSCSTGVVAQTIVEVFVDQPFVARSMPNAVITVFDLSRVSALEDETPDFPPDPMVAQVQATAWFDSAAGKQHLLALKAAYVGHEKMVRYGVQKIPAIVFNDGKFAVYGTTDIAQAIRDFDHYVQTHTAPSGVNQGDQH
jgi:integrating conjugative element protein (TIGR03757 family)